MAPAGNGKPVKILHVLGSPGTHFDYNLSLFYGKMSIKAGYDKIYNYNYSLALVHPGGEWSFPANADDIKCPRLKLSQAIEKIESLNLDVVLSHMFCLKAPTYKALFEMMKIPVIGADATTMANIMDKASSRAKMIAAGLPVPEGMLLDKFSLVKDIKPSLPCVVKPTTMENSVGVTLVHKQEDVEDAINLALSMSPQCIVDNFIPGREIRIGTVEDSEGHITPLPAFEYLDIGKADIRKFEDKLECADKEQLGLSKTSMTRYLDPLNDQKLIEKLGKLAVHNHIAMNCRDFGQLDCRVTDDGEIYILECNTFCSISPSSVINRMYKEAGFTDAELMNLMVTNALQRSEKKLIKEGGA